MAEVTPAWRRFLRNVRWGNPGKNWAWDEHGQRIWMAPPTKSRIIAPGTADRSDPLREYFRTPPPATSVRAAPPPLHGPLGDYYRKFAETAIRQMEAGTAPWQRSSKTGDWILPRNAVTHRAYTAGNAVYLAVRGQDRGFTDNRWMTMQQIKEARAQPPTGPGERILVRHEDKGLMPVCRTSTVYNVEQVRGLKLDRRPPRPDWLAHRGADAVIAASPVEVVELRDEGFAPEAYYSKEDDRVRLPFREEFRSPEHYYSTALRNMAHGSGHPDRLDRETWNAIVAEFEIGPPSRELLRAEIATLTVCDRLGVGYQPFADDPVAVRDPTEDPDYTKAWIKALKEDPREMHRAASEGHRIAEHLIQPARGQLRNIVREARAALDAEMPERTSSVRPVPALTPPAPARQQPAMTPGR